MTEQDFELLSAYIDNALTPQERAVLESRLMADAALRAELEALQRTVTMIRTLPELRAPRDYTLDPAVYGRPAAAAPSNVIDFTQAAKTPPRTRGISRLLIAAASVVLAFVAVVALLTQQNATAPTSTSGGIALAVTATLASTQAALPTEEAQAELFTFNEPEILVTGAVSSTDSASIMQRSAAMETPQSTPLPPDIETETEAAADLMMAPPAAEEESAGSSDAAAASSMLDESSLLQEAMPVQPSITAPLSVSVRQAVGYALVVMIVWRLMWIRY